MPGLSEWPRNDRSFWLNACALLAIMGVLQKGWMTKEALDDVLRPENMTHPRRLPGAVGKALAAYREVGYAHMLMPDHVALHPDDPDRFQALAFCYGYIRGILQATE